MDTHKNVNKENLSINISSFFTLKKIVINQNLTERCFHCFDINAEHQNQIKKLFRFFKDVSVVIN